MPVDPGRVAERSIRARGFSALVCPPLRWTASQHGYSDSVLPQSTTRCPARPSTNHPEAIRQDGDRPDTAISDDQHIAARYCLQLFNPPFHQRWQRQAARRRLGFRRPGTPQRPSRPSAFLVAEQHRQVEYQRNASPAATSLRAVTTFDAAQHGRDRCAATWTPPMRTGKRCQRHLGGPCWVPTSAPGRAQGLRTLAR